MYPGTGRENFNPPAPCGAGLQNNAGYARKRGNFNPPAPCGAGRRSLNRFGRHIPISIHPPHAGRDQGRAKPRSSAGTFQSTRPMRGGTVQTNNYCATAKIFQSTRPMRGGTLQSPVCFAAFTISIHPPHAGRDLTTATGVFTFYRFQSTRPMRGGTRPGCVADGYGNNFNPPAPCGAGPRY